MCPSTLSLAPRIGLRALSRSVTSASVAAPATGGLGVIVHSTATSSATAQRPGALAGRDACRRQRRARKQQKGAAAVTRLREPDAGATHSCTSAWRLGAGGNMWKYIAMTIGMKTTCCRRGAARPAAPRAARGLSAQADRRNSNPGCAWSLQQRVLDVVKELDGERDRPPAMVIHAGEPRSQQPEAGEHHQRVPVVQRFRLHEPGEEISQRAARLGHRPAQRIDLKRLQQVLGPVREHDHHEDTQRQLVPGTVQPLDERHGLTGLMDAGMHRNPVRYIVALAIRYGPEIRCTTDADRPLV